MKMSGFWVVLTLYEFLFSSIVMPGLKLVNMKTTEAFLLTDFFSSTLDLKTFKPHAEAPADIIFSCISKISC